MFGPETEAVDPLDPRDTRIMGCLCTLKSVRFVRDGTLKLLLLLSRGEVVLEFELNTVEPLHNGHLGDGGKSPLWRGGR